MTKAVGVKKLNMNTYLTEEELKKLSIEEIKQYRDTIYIRRVELDKQQNKLSNDIINIELLKHEINKEERAISYCVYTMSLLLNEYTES